MCFYEFVSCLWKSAHRKNSILFQNGPPSFYECVFFHVRDAQKKKILALGPILGLWEAEMGFGAQLRIREGPLWEGKASAVCVCVCGGCNGVSNAC